VLAPQIRDGKVKGLLMTSSERSPQLPDAPTGLCPAKRWFYSQPPARQQQSTMPALTFAIRFHCRKPSRIASIRLSPQRRRAPHLFP
jgi:hypothetical protein